MIKLSWTFEDGVEGWRQVSQSFFLNKNQEITSATQASTSDALVAHDSYTTSPQFYTPADLSGDQSKLFGGTLEFNWINQDDNPNGNGTIYSIDVVIAGQDGSRIRINMDVPDNSDDITTGTFSAILDPSAEQPENEMRYSIPGQAGWVRPTADDMRHVLGQLDSIRLAGDIRGGMEYMRIEDVSITPICFTSGTLIATPDGERAVETLRPGDLVMTRDHGPQELRWLGMRAMKAADFAAKPKIRPIRIRAGALGHNTPVRDLVVSPQHRILLQSKIVQRIFDEPQVLTAAKNLLELPGVEMAEDLTQVTYIHLMFDRHELVLADGAWSESLYLGKQAKLNLTGEQREEIETIFPGLMDEETPHPPARSFAKGSSTRKLVQRSIRNGQPLFAGTG